MDAPAAVVLALALVPWIGAGLADWACHRATGIAVTSGLPENLLHWAMFGQMAVVVVAIALLEPTAAVLVLVAGGFLVHEATVWVDLRYTQPRRRIPPVEQMVHSVQEMLPLFALALLAVTAWDQARALVGLGPAVPDWSWRWRTPMPPPWLLAAGAGAALLCNLVPLAQETRACLRARALRSRTRPSPAPR
jgi:hypothetical protein